MKVYTVWSGCYSDMDMIGVFSTRELAQEYIDYMQNIDNDIHSEPEEHEVDEIKVAEKADFVINGPDEYFVDYAKIFDRDDFDIHLGTLFGENYYRIGVNINKNKDVMIKAARDKLAMRKAREAGL